MGWLREIALSSSMETMKWDLVRDFGGMKLAFCLKHGTMFIRLSDFIFVGGRGTFGPKISKTNHKGKLGGSLDKTEGSGGRKPTYVNFQVT